MTLQDRLRAAAQTSDHPPTFGLLFEAADALDALRHDLAEARRIAGRHSTELGHLRKLHVPGGFRSALTDKGEPAAFVPIGPIEPGSAPGLYRLTPTNAPALLQASVNALRDRWAAETDLRLRDLEVGQRLAGCLPSLDWPADWRVLQPGENPPLGREWTIWGPMTPEARALADAEASIPEARRLLGIADDPTINVVAEALGCPEGTCLAKPRCRNRAEMRAAHGTPDEFELAIMRAAPELSVAEADRAMASYRAAWEAASEPDVSMREFFRMPPAARDAVYQRRFVVSVSGDPATVTKLGLDPQGVGVPEGYLVHPSMAPYFQTSPERFGPPPEAVGLHVDHPAEYRTPEDEAEAAEQAERFQGLDDSDRE